MLSKSTMPITKSNPTTPIKNSRTPKSRDGGLTPLPNDPLDLDTLDMKLDKQSVLQILQLETKQGFSIENEIKQDLSVTEEPDEELTETTHTINTFLNDLFQRQESLGSLQQNADDHLIRLQKAVATKDSQIIQGELNRHGLQGHEVERIQMGLIKIKEFDSVIKMKSEVYFTYLRRPSH